MHHFTYTKHNAPDNGEVHREIQSVGRNLLHVPLQAPRIWRCSQIFGKLCVSLLEIFVVLYYLHSFSKQFCIWFDFANKQ
jgi:hypothetical protein